MSNIKIWEKDFQANLEKKEEDEPSVVAQRLINIYHQLAVLGEDAVKKYNKMVLEKGVPAVLIALSTMPSGKEVREYIDFLQNKTTENQEKDNKKDKSGATPKLPKAEELSPIWQTLGWGGGGAAPVCAPVAQPQPQTPPFVASTTPTDDKALAFLKEQSLTLIDSQNQDVVQALRDVLTGTTEGQEKSALQDAVLKITSLQERNKDILASIYQTNMPIDVQSATVKVKETRPVFTASKRKNKKRRPFPKFSVKLIDEDESS